MKQPDDNIRLAVRNKPVGRKPVMYQTWDHLLFLHWEVPADIIQKTLPKGLTVDTYNGKAYLGLVPFYMKNIRPVFFPPVPGISNFLETNVRTYVYDENGIPGVWFYSLDANQSLAVWIARTFYKLPYHRAKMKAILDEVGGKVMYETQRRQTLNPSVFEYLTGKDVNEATPGTLEFFLLERYILFSWNESKKKLMKGQVIHTPYQFRETKANKWDDALLGLNQFELPNRKPELMHYAPGVNVEVYAIEPA